MTDDAPHGSPRSNAAALMIALALLAVVAAAVAVRAARARAAIRPEGFGCGAAPPTVVSLAAPPREPFPAKLDYEP